MGETINISKMAEILSNDLFSEFYWQRTGPTNTNWPCEEEKRHGNKHHPTDAVFWYDNPYSLSRTYLNTDLKSYAAGSIKPGAIADAIESLGKSINCAEKSAEWQKRFLHENVNHDICGLLFIYNHDGEYDREFAQVLQGVKASVFELPKRSKIVVLGPSDIYWLDNVRYEIVQMRGKGLLPPVDQCSYYYPNLSQKKNVQPDLARAANIEMLTSPWIILSHTNPREPQRKVFDIFYRRRGDSVKEFLYLIDYLMHYQVFLGQPLVRIKTLDSDPLAPALFSKALDEYLQECQNSPEIKSRLSRIEYTPMTQIKTRFSDIQIGMDNE